MKHLTRALTGIIAVILTAACTEKIDVEIDHSDFVLVVEGTITNIPDRHTVKLTKSGPYFSNLPAEKVSGATVTIEDFYNKFTLLETSEGVYQTNPWARGYPGIACTLRVEYEGQVYTATSFMKRVARIDSIRFYLNDNEWKNISIGMWAQEPSSPGDYYMFSALVEDTLDTDTITELVIVSDHLFNGNNFSGVLVQHVNAAARNKVTLVMANISSAYYEFLLAVLRATKYSDALFEAAPAPIRGNISNGALGFFSAHAVSMKSGEVAQDIIE